MAGLGSGSALGPHRLDGSDDRRAWGVPGNLAAGAAPRSHCDLHGRAECERGFRVRPRASVPTELLMGHLLPLDPQKATRCARRPHIPMGRMRTSADGDSCKCSGSIALQCWLRQGGSTDLLGQIRLQSFTINFFMTKTYAQLAREIAALQAAAQKQLAIEAKGVIAKINESIALYGLTAGDLTFASSAAPTPLSGLKKTKAAKATKAKNGAVTSGAKFSDGDGNQWGGRGPRPAWLRNALAAGRTLESFASNAAAAPIAAGLAEPAMTKSIASEQIKSGAGSAKAKSNKASAPAKSSPSATVAAHALATTTPTKASRKKVAAKAPRGSAAGVPSSRAVKSAVKKSVATKGAATQAVRPSQAKKKSAGAKPPSAGSKPAAPAKKAAVQKAVHARKKAAATSAAREASGVKSQGPSASEAFSAPAAG